MVGALGCVEKQTCTDTVVSLFANYCASTLRLYSLEPKILTKQVKSILFVCTEIVNYTTTFKIKMIKQY